MRSMGCAEERPWGRRAAACLTGNPRLVVLLVVGIGAFVAGVSPVVADVALSSALVVVGAGVVVLGTLAPVVREVDIGPGGFRLKLVEQARDDAFAAFLTDDYVEQLRGCATSLICDAGRAAEVVERVLVDGYVNQARVSPDGMHRYLLCRLVQRSRAELLLASARSELPAADGIGSALCSLDFEDRMVLVLHHREALTPESIAGVLGLSVNEVRTAIDAAQLRLPPPPVDT